MRNYQLLSFLLLIFWAIPARGLGFLPESEISWKNVVVDGRKSAVYCIFRDSNGLAWIGSNHGLSFYDGISTRKVGAEVLEGTHVYSMAEKDGKLYLGTNNGLFILNKKEGKVSPYDKVSDREIRVLMLAGDELWIGGIHGLHRLNISNGKISDISRGLPHKSVYSLFRDSRGVVYAGTYRGAARWDPSDQRFMPLEIVVDGDDRTSFLANCIIEDVDNRYIYVGGEGGLVRLEVASGKWENVAGVGMHNVKSIALGENGALLIGSDNGVIEYIPERSVTLHKHDSRKETSLADNEIWCIYSDDDHILWAGHEMGFSLTSNSDAVKKINIGALTDSGEGNEIYNALRSHDGTLWLGGSNGVIELPENGKVKWHLHTDMPGAVSHKRIRAIYEDLNGNIWLATDGGIDRYDKASGKFEVYRFTDRQGNYNSNWVYALGETGGQFWAGGFLSGIHLVESSSLPQSGGNVRADMSLNESGKGYSGEKLSNSMVNNAVTAPDGKLWILLFRDRYVNVYDSKSKKLTKIDILEAAGEYPTHLAKDRLGRIWCAFRGGAAVMEDAATCRIVKFPATSVDESVTSMGAVDDDMWISTIGNLWKIDGLNLRPSILSLPPRAYTAIYDDTMAGSVILGVSDEITVIDKKKFNSRPAGRGIRMAILSTEGEPMDFSAPDFLKDGLKIPYGGSAALMVSTLNYAPDAIQRFMYRLAESPTDTLGDWMFLPEGMNTITLSDLKVGKHHLLVRSPETTEGTLSIPIYVRPPLWLSWWVIVLYMMILVFLMGVSTWYVRRRSEYKYREQKRLETLANTEKRLAFLSSISNSLKTPLSMIMMSAGILKEKSGDEESRRGFEAIHSNAVKLNNTIRRTLENEQIEGVKEKIRAQAIVHSKEQPIEAESSSEKTLAKIAKTIEENISDPELNVSVLSEKTGISSKQLYRLLKKYMDMTPVDYIRNVRLRKAAVLLKQRRFTVSEISYMVGFNTPSYFTKCFQKEFGVKPSQYSADNEDMSNLLHPLS